MNRRGFLESAVSTLVGALMDRANRQDGMDSPSSKTDAGDYDGSCSACSAIAELQSAWIDTEYSEYKVHKLETLLRPENHSWKDGCHLAELPEIDGVDYTVEDFQEMDYEIRSSFNYSIVEISLFFEPETPLQQVETTVTIGDSE